MMDDWIIAGIVVVLATVAFGLAYLTGSKARASLAGWRSRRSLARARAMALMRPAATTPSGALRQQAAPPAPSGQLAQKLTTQPVEKPYPAPAKGRFYDRMAAIMMVSDSLTVEQLAAALGVDVAFVWQHVFGWADHFGFKVVDGRVVFKGGGDVEGLAAELDRHFKEWESKEKLGDGKA